MSELKEFKLPDVGEGLTEADIVTWHVKPGDQVTVNQIIVEIETAKAVVELPSPTTGRSPGCWPRRARPSTSGTPIIAVDVSAGDRPPGETESAERSAVTRRRSRPRPPAEPRRAAACRQPGRPRSTAQAALHRRAARPRRAERQPVLVGYGVKASATTRRARKTARPRPAAGRSGTGPVARRRQRQRRPGSTGGPGAGQAAGTQAGQGPRRRPGRADRHRAGRRRSPGTTCSGRPLQPGPFGTRGLPARGPDGRPGRAARPGRRGAHPDPRRAQAHRRGDGGQRVHRAACHRVPADRHHRDDGCDGASATCPSSPDVRVSPLLLVARALLVAARRHPMINSCWDEARRRSWSSTT